MKNQSDGPAIMRKIAPILIIILSGLAIGGLAWYGPIPQDPSYHAFADRRTLFQIPSFWNVATNLPFVLVGLLGLHRCAGGKNHSPATKERISFLLFFSGVLLTGITSGAYHLQPDNWWLLWDRLAMAISFMAFLAIVIGAFGNSAWGGRLLGPLVLYGIFSVGYWIGTERMGAGDLRLYVLTQFLPILIIPAIIFTRPARSVPRSDILIIGAGYGLAKLFELLDAQFYQLIFFSGHSLKHLAATFSAYWLLKVMARCQIPQKPMQQGRP